MQTTTMLNGTPVKDPRKGITQPKAASTPPRVWIYRQWWPNIAYMPPIIRVREGVVILPKT